MTNNKYTHTRAHTHTHTHTHTCIVAYIILELYLQKI